MSVSPTLNRAARILALVSPRDPVDVVLRRELAPRRDLPPAERRGIVQAIAAYFRWLGWLDPDASPQRRVEAALEMQARFDANPTAFKPETLAARAVPEWLKAELEAVPVEWLRQLQRDPPLWIRVRQRFADSLPQALGDCIAASLPSTLDLRLSTAFRYTGAQDLFLTEPFQRGQFEIQDLASQVVGHACAPAASETWWDAFAGEGGKTLHLADLMQNKGLIWASDRSVRRLQVLKKRAARAEVFNYRTVAWNGGPQPPTKTRFDGVLVDAPCSGVGTWQRHPQARWTVSPADVRELTRVQQQLLDHVAGSVKPGGRLVYSVCTLTRAETRDVVSRFSTTHPEFAPIPVFPNASSGKPGAASPSPGPEGVAPVPDVSPATSVLLWPHELNANGMFIAAWRKQA
ncbi:MAG TPA: RsmB/NOP family class I SAM-dependent RNA methyltransferase [Opitutaceae bacterium]|nr:RsmB/NOP family class I SAM-dependent RNA methyltransferase [Opitutaceae bacterium]